MAAWKKVLVEDANITVGTVTATLGEGTDVSAGGTVNVVVSATDGGTEGALTVAEMAFGDNAFNSTAFLTAVPNNTYQVQADTVGGEVVLSLTGNTVDDSVSFEEATNSPIVITQDSDAIVFDIPDATNAVTGVLAGKLGHISTMKVLGNVTGATAAVAQVAILDEDDLSGDSATSLATQQSIKAYVDAQVLASGSGTVTEVIGGTNIGVTSGTSTPTVNLDANIALSKVGGNAGSGDDAAGSALTIVGGAGTGTGAGGDIVFKTSTPSGSTGSSANTLVTAMTISDDQSVTIAGDLIVNGSTTTLDTANLLVEDTFIALNSGGATNVDAGIVFTGNVNKVFGWDQSQENGRFGVDYADGDASVAGGGFSPDAWVSTVHSGAASGQTSALAQIGNIYTISGSGDDAGDIYIYS